MYCFILLLLLYCPSAFTTLHKRQIEDDVTKVVLQMPGYVPQVPDEYGVLPREAPPGYIVGFEPLAVMDRIHHILIFGCTKPAHTSIWKGYEVCGEGVPRVLYAWARNAQPLYLPNNVAFSVGHEDDSVKYFVMQVHYAKPFVGDVIDYSGVTIHMTQNRPENFADILLMVYAAPVPPGRHHIQLDVSCLYRGDVDLHPFAFRTHTHAMGRVVSAFYKHEGHWKKIGVRHPHWPQIFQTIEHNPVIRKGDLIASTCRFDSHTKTQPTPMGPLDMCNFYMMYYYNASEKNPFPNGSMCVGNEKPTEVKNYPMEGTRILPARPVLERSSHATGIAFGVVEKGAFTSVGDVKLGQIASLAFQDERIFAIFHRAGRVWGEKTFDQHNVLVDQTPIKNDVILIVALEGNELHLVKKLGRGKFYLPHGIHIDNEGFLYTADAGSHTVAKWKIENNNLDLIWESGTKLIPGNGNTHFCKPTAVVTNDEGVFVADGYCNNRIVQLDKATGKRLFEFEGQLNVPHDIATSFPGPGFHLFVADRENGKVKEFHTRGDLVTEWASPLFTNIYAVDVHDDYVFMVPGRAGGFPGPARVYAGRTATPFIEYSFAPTSRPFGEPHALRVSPDGYRIIVGDNSKPTLFLFQIQPVHATSQFSLSFHESHDQYVYNGFVNAPAVIMTALAVTILVGGFVKILAGRRRTIAEIREPGKFDKKGYKPLDKDDTAALISEGSENEEP
ncbi:unnamed protein product [Cylicocyclus nassatus]|uniref:peptidylglycine monooxygenase n=1 Tax=Cylicocyclus nassatus TaxID=53992 RepID=A0AA36GKM8_CYLNA|nr:unnamed protein product [Cylicocyclus nassatus]